MASEQATPSTSEPIRGEDPAAITSSSIQTATSSSPPPPPALDPPQLAIKILPRPVGGTSTTTSPAATPVSTDPVGALETLETKITLLKRTVDDSAGEDSAQGVVRRLGSPSIEGVGSEKKAGETRSVPDVVGSLGDQENDTTPSSSSISSPVLSPSATTECTPSLPTELDGRSTEEECGETGLDPALMTALLLPRDRFLLMRAEVEMERFLADPTCVLFHS